MSYLKQHGTRRVPQWSPIPGSDQVPNSAGGFAWAWSVWMLAAPGWTNDPWPGWRSSGRRRPVTAGGPGWRPRRRSGPVPSRAG